MALTDARQVAALSVVVRPESGQRGWITKLARSTVNCQDAVDALSAWELVGQHCHGVGDIYDWGKEVKAAIHAIVTDESDMGFGKLYAYRARRDSGNNCISSCSPIAGWNLVDSGWGHIAGGEGRSGHHYCLSHASFRAPLS
jgi:hypothetical protein